MRRSAIFFVLGLFALTTFTSAETYLKETFSDKDWEKRWINSKHKDDLGTFVVTSGDFYADEIEARGLSTFDNAKFYAISTKLDKVIDNTDKDIVVQFSVKHEQGIDCGGGYVKLLPPGFDALSFEGDSLYNIMFGPDICGVNRKVHVILHFKGENKQIKKEIKAKWDTLTHLYTLIIKPDHTYKVLIDLEEEASGTLEEDFDLLPPKEIPDANAKKPDDWVDEAEIPDPDDHKPTDWVDHPATIPDPDAKKPDDWDDEMDGDWEPPQISNPEYKGEWKQKKIPNPEYKGEWKAPMIPNPEYTPEPLLHAYKTEYIGFDLWQVKAGTIFDNILITDDVKEAETFANETFVKYQVKERDAKRILDEIENGTSDEIIDDKDDKKDSKKDDDDDIIDLDVKLGDDGEVKVTVPNPNLDKDEKEKSEKKEEKKEEKREEKKEEKVEKEKEGKAEEKEKAKEVKAKADKAKEVKVEKEKTEEVKVEKEKAKEIKTEKPKVEKEKETKVEKEKEAKVEKDEKAKEVKVEKDEKAKEVKVEKDEKTKVKETKDEKDEMDKLLDDFEEELGLPKKEKGHKLPIRDEF